MIYRFTIISDEIEDFVREIRIDSEATFFDLHEAIRQSMDYKDDQMTSFFTCEDNWEKDKEITLEEMENNPEEDSWVMRETLLSDLLEDEKQKLVYQFDPLAERAFYIELSEIITGQNLEKAVCTRKQGEAPKQTLDFDELTAGSTATLDMDENFYGDQDFDLDDFDPEGFDIGGGSGNVAEEEEKF